jgi:hypothetical protein
VPGEHASKLACPFVYKKMRDGNVVIGVRKMQVSDWLHMAGPIGIYYINQTDIHDRYKLAFAHVLKWIHGYVRTRSVSISDLSEDDHDTDRISALTYWKENAVILEYLMPRNFNQINTHLWQHAVAELLYAGPVYGHWMFPFESCAHWMKAMLHSPKSPEEGLARQLASEWRSMLHRYDNLDPKLELAKIINPIVYRGRTPPVVEILSRRGQVDPALFNPDTTDSHSPYKLIHAYFLANDRLSKFVQREFERVHTRTNQPNSWKTFDIRKWNMSDSSVQRILKEMTLNRVEPLPTRDDLEVVKLGPVAADIQTISKLKVNETVFCDTVKDGHHKTTNHTIRYEVRFGNTEDLGRWRYANIAEMYCVRAYGIADTRHCTRKILLRVHNYANEHLPNKKAKKVGSKEQWATILTKVNKMNRAASIDSADHLSIVAIDNVDDVNVAIWKGVDGSDLTVVALEAADAFNLD